MNRPRPVPLAVHGALLVAALGLGGLAVAGKAALHTFPPGVLALVRSAGAATVLLALAAARGQARIPDPRRTLPRLVVCAFFGVVVNQLLFLHGLRLTTATASSILVCTIPVFTPVFAWLGGLGPAGGRQAAGIGVALAGVLTLLRADPAALATTGASTAGNLMVVANAAGYSLYLVLLRPLGGRMPAVATTGWLYALGAVAILPVGLWEGAGFRWSSVPPAAWGSVAYVILGGTVIPYTLIVRSLPAAGPTLAALYTYIQPMTTALLAALLLGERLGARDALAAGLIFLGVRLASGGLPRRG